ncbi:hypothetical protein Bcen2424_6927 (plasmid) [Burkholderia cenocepacia HI2424]|nr:hypothetical protein Bcen2424_6927 [Burkholderia cenocepacia HI2424]
MAIGRTLASGLLPLLPERPRRPEMQCASSLMRQVVVTETQRNHESHHTRVICRVRPRGIRHRRVGPSAATRYGRVSHARTAGVVVMKVRVDSTWRSFVKPLNGPWVLL